MRSVHVDGLVVVTDHLGVLEGLELPVHALLLEALLVGGLVVAPVHHHASLAGVDGSVGHVNGGEVASVLKLLAVVETRLQVVDVATCELIDHEVAVECGASFGRLAVQCHGARELRIHQIIEAVDVAVLVGVPTDRHNAGIVGVILAVGILHGIRDLIPSLHLVGGEVVGAGGGHGQAEVEHVGGSVGALVSLGCVHFFLGGGVRVQLVDLNVRILLLEAVDNLTIVGPVVRKCDDVELAFLFGGGNQIVHRTEISQGSSLCRLFINLHSLAGSGISGGIRAVRSAGGHGESQNGRKGAGGQFAQRNHGHQYLSYALFITTRKKISPQISVILTLQ